MKIDSFGPDFVESSLDEITSEGMIQIANVWVMCEVSIIPEKETEKAYYGAVTVYECDDVGRADIIYTKNTWLPKSMAENPWWICSKLFDHYDKVANRRFIDYDLY